MIKLFSASSISSHLECPRKFYHRYIERLPSEPNIHLIRGNILHSTVEKFFDNCNASMSLKDFQFMINNLFLACWNQKRSELASLNLPDLNYYFEESQLMASNWVNHFNEELEREMENGHSRDEAIKRLTPKTEVHIVSDELRLQGYLDAIHEKDGTIEILDYKTSKKDDIQDYLFQLGIYGLLYLSKFKRLPDKASIFFFKHGQRSIQMTKELIEKSKHELTVLKEKLSQTTEKKDYNQKVSGLCKYSTGQCDFYNLCFKNDIEFQEARNNSY
tara:strand:+ start:2152 stop:2973 length:822 start_codon:yes stop_codon:yes gene_type:complete